MYTPHHDTGSHHFLPRAELPNGLAPAIAPMIGTSPACVVAYLDDSLDDQFLFLQAVGEGHPPMSVKCFSSSEPLLAYLKAEPPFDDNTEPSPAFILCDFDLCNEKGSEVVARIRELSQCKDVPIVMFSGRDSRDAVAEAYTAGANHFLQKPISLADLQRLVNVLRTCATAFTPPDFSALLDVPEYRSVPTSGEEQHRSAA